ncbi:hypothetical protein T265_00338 [Opisthorchis viverrini]|uniref:Uncharacterized protein n=1 Tax=Opisthorchis viverrini TaxID=6198 RepID=A0A075AJS5_OPIVI|nr:hypothetical protein T265_00338 [Opisthorchis viverrini]KER33894.1 hypothetical protein T265_00338 [Opisthorchis viverrini]
MGAGGPGNAELPGSGFALGCDGRGMVFVLGVGRVVLVEKEVLSGPARWRDELSCVPQKERLSFGSPSATDSYMVPVSPRLFCETWLSPSTPDAIISLPGYIIFRSDRSNRRGGGCLIYARNEMEVCTIDDPLLVDTPDSVWISAFRANPPFILECLYMPPLHSISSINRLSTLLSHT